MIKVFTLALQAHHGVLGFWGREDSDACSEVENKHYTFVAIFTMHVITSLLYMFQ